MLFRDPRPTGLNGQIFLDDAGIDINRDLRVKGITGQAEIVRNNLDINKLEGLLGEAPVGVEGKIINIFAPKYDLSLFGTGLNPAGFGLPELTGLKMGSVVNFQGKINGELWNPLISGEIQIDRLEYEDLSAENLKATIAWDITSKSLRILTGREIGAGSFLTEEQSEIISKGVEWKVSGDFAELELGSTSSVPLALTVKFQLTALKGDGDRVSRSSPVLGTFKGRFYQSRHKP